MKESLNALTSLAVFFACPQWPCRSMLAFVSLAWINHLFPRNLADYGGPYLVKMVYTLAVFEALSTVVPFVEYYHGVAIALCDLPIVISTIFPDWLPKGSITIWKAGSNLGMILRQGSILITVFDNPWTVNFGVRDQAIWVALNLLYYYERSARISTDTRFDYSYLHSGEHFAVALWFAKVYDYFPTNENIQTGIFWMLLGHIFCIYVLSKILCLYDAIFLEANLPSWFDKRLTGTIKKKTMSNLCAWGFKDMAKYFSPKIKLDIITWNRMEEDVRNWNFPAHKFKDIDLVVGIVSGGAFIAPIFAQVIGERISTSSRGVVSRRLPVDYLKSHMWSRQGFFETLGKVKSLAKRMAKATDSSDSLEAKAKVGFSCLFGTPIEGKRILLVDDSTFSGMTMKVCSRRIKELGAKSVTTVVYIHAKGFAKFTPDYVVANNVNRVPICYPWGWEMD